MKNFQSRIAVCNQKGGVGKSTFTVLLASYLHYNMGHDILVMDCDYPQWSIHAQRERELKAIERSDYYKLMMVRQFKATGRKIWPVIRCMPSEAFEKEESLLQSGYRPRIILYDLPGTVNSEGVLHILSSLDSIFIPLKAANSSWKVLSPSPEVSIEGWFTIKFHDYRAFTSSGR